MSGYRAHIVPVGVLLLLGSLAFVRLLALPAFEDEGTQLRMIWRALEAGEWLEPLGIGKPLEVWPMVPLMRLSVQPLMAIRALHTLIGIVGALLTYRLALQLLSAEADRLDNLLGGRPPVWIVIAEQLRPRYLESSFGRGGAARRLRRVASFDKPGARAQLVLYEVVR